MAAPVPSPASAASTGLNDSVWIADARRKLRDQPSPTNGSWTADGVNGAFGPGSSPVGLGQGPVYDGEPVATYVAVFDTTASQTYTVLTSGTPSTNQVLVNFDTQTLTFATPPTSTHVFALGWYTVKWTNAAILAALYAGLRQMFPSVGKTYLDSTIQIQVNVWDYLLPLWAQSPDAQVSKIEFRDPDIPTEPWRPLHNWQRVGISHVHLPQAQRMSPVAKLRVTGWGPYITLADLEPDLYNLPIWYAGSVLLPWQESFRIREDTQVPLTQEGGQSPGLLTQTGDYYQKRFDAELRQKARAYGPPGASRPILTTYQVNHHI